MSKKTFVIFINIIIDDSFLPALFLRNRLFEAFYYFFEYGIIKHKFLTIHYGLHIGRRQKLACFENNTICTSIQNIYPKLFIQHLTCEYKYFYFRVILP